MSEPKKKVVAWGRLEISVLVVLVSLIAVIAIPNYLRSTQTGSNNSCISNLRQIEGAKHSWALENHKDTNATPSSSDVAQFLKNNQLPVCPQGGTYSLDHVGENPTCTVHENALPTP